MLRLARVSCGLTQAQLAKSAGVSRATLTRLETGNFPDIGVKKLQALLENVGLTLNIQQASTKRRTDYIRVAATTASASFKEPLTEAELVKALLRGKIPRGRKPHFRLLFEETRPALMRGLVSEISRWTRAGKLEKNLQAIALDLGVTNRADEWLKTD